VKPFPVVLIGLVFSALFLTYAVAQRLRGGSEKSIPKWKS